MGLAITAISEARWVHYQEEDCDNEKHFLVYSDDGLEDLLDGLRIGCYVSDKEAYNFEAGSYEGFKEWRETLCNIIYGKTTIDFVYINAKQLEGKPFFELLYMSDCMGSIGPETSKKLSVDFTNYYDQVFCEIEKFASPQKEIQWKNKYNKWLEAFTVASNNGFVIFH